MGLIPNSVRVDAPGETDTIDLKLSNTPNPAALKLDPPTYSAVGLSTLKRVDKICEEFDAQWRRGENPSLEAALASNANDEDKQVLFRELLAVELEYRIGRGESLQCSDFLARFPGLEQVVELAIAQARPKQKDDLEDLNVQRGFKQRDSLFAPSNSSPMASAELGDYELLSEIARGGMGVVFKARQRSLNRIVAFKMILSGALADNAEVERFKAEATAAAKLDHPAIVPIYEVGQQGGQHFFAMGFVDGPSLAQRIASGPLAPREASVLLRTVAEAVHYAHQQGVIHRDLKPANILLDSQGRPRITDFGLAKQMTGGAELTASGQVFGTPAYMPPEQASGHSSLAAATSDVYSLGAVLYASLVGRPPFQAASVWETLKQVLETEPISPRRLNSSVPRDLETIVLHCLEKSPDRRYATAQQVADELGRFQDGAPINARPLSVPARGWRWCRRRPLLAGLLVAVALLTGVVGVGISVANLKLQQSLGELQAAEKEQTEQLWLALIARAEAERMSGRSGHREAALTSLHRAAAIARERQMSAERLEQLRNEATASVPLVDARLNRKWDAHSARLSYGGFTPKFDLFATADEAGNISLRRVEDDAVQVKYPAIGGSPWYSHASFSPNGRFCRAQRGDTLYLYDLEKTSLEPCCRLEKDGVFTPDSRSFVINQSVPNPKQQTLFFYDPATGKLQRQLKSPANGDISFSADCQRAAVTDGPGRRVFIIDLKNGQTLQTISVPAEPNISAWHPGGERLAIGCNETVYLFDLTTQKHVAKLTEHGDRVIWCFFNPSGTLLVTASWDGTSRLWDANTGRPIQRLMGTALSFDEAGQRLGFQRESDTGYWEIHDGRECQTYFGDLPANPGQTALASFSSDGRLLATGGLMGVQIWDMANGNLLTRLPTGQTQGVAFQPGGDKLITFSRVSGLRCWQLERDENAGKMNYLLSETAVWLPPEEKLYRQATWSSNGKRLIASNDTSGELLLFEAAEPAKFRRLQALPRVTINSISRDGHWAAAASWRAQAIRILDLNGGQAPRDVFVESDATHSAFSPDNKWLVYDDQGAYRFLSVDDWKPGPTIPHQHGGGSRSLAFSPAGELLAIVDQIDEVRLLDAQTRAPLVTLISPDPRQIYWLCFNPMGDRLAVSRGKFGVQVFDLRAIRAELARLGLDWPAPPYPPSEKAAELKLEVIPLKSNPTP